MQTAFTSKAENSGALVEMEANLEKYRTETTRQIILDYNNMVEWLMELHKNPYIEIAEEQIKQIQMAFNQTNKINQHIEQQEISLKTQRDEIEKKLSIETKAFMEELNDIKQTVGAFGGNVVKKKEEEYNKSIDKINKTLASLGERLLKINE